MLALSRDSHGFKRHHIFPEREARREECCSSHLDRAGGFAADSQAGGRRRTISASRGGQRQRVRRRASGGLACRLREGEASEASAPNLATSRPEERLTILKKCAEG